MVRNWTVIATIVTVALWISGCETLDHVDSKEFEKLGLFYNGQPVEAMSENEFLKALGDKQKLTKDKKIVKKTNDEIRNDELLLGIIERGEIEALIDEIEAGQIDPARLDEVPNHLFGVQGIALDMYIKVKILNRDIIRKGRIRDYVFDEEKRAGHLAVEVTSYHLDGRIPRNVVKRETLHWDVKVNENTYKVVPRDDKKPKDPFPGTVTLPAPALDPNNKDSIWARKLDHKLFAQGTGIEVMNVYRKVDNNRLERLDREKYPTYYASTEEACIDLLFNGWPPELTLPKQRSYCLGRCEHPDIINSK